MIDLSFCAIGMEVLGRAWPTFAGGAAIQTCLARLVYRSGRYSSGWVVINASVALVGTAALAWQSTVAAEGLFQQIGEGAHVRPWDEFNLYLQMAGPPLLGFCAAHIGLAAYWRSERAVIGVGAAAGVLASWVIAMWLYTTVHHEAVLRVMLLPGTLGVVASLLGFTASTALWMAMARWRSR